MRSTKVIAITGASAGIGEATALRLARDGASLALCARRGDRLDAVASQVTTAGGQALAVVADVTSQAAMDEFVRATIGRFGRLDVMICNAGFGIAGAIDDISPEQMQRLMAVNYFGTFHAARAALPVFRRQGQGHLIVVSSIVGKRGVPYMGAYSATKFAQVGLAECLRAEVAGSPIHVTVVFPVSTDTEFFAVMSRETGTTIKRSSFGPKQDVAQVADSIARAIEHPVPELHMHLLAHALVWVSAAWPSLADRLVKRFGRQPIR
ncbi:MAG TPA: SDR family NAD(P)-dependent oxidoreductase [Vicinamibacterales bacterium]|nr:SDR family NAD(P)-dependent oxidoreductase [Vicinamibacterales bacterium]